MLCAPVKKADSINTLLEVDMRKEHVAGKSYGCDDCSYLKEKRCTLWEMKIAKPKDSHCESHDVK